MTEHKREGRSTEATEGGTQPGPSREAMLEADGIRITKAVAEVPARPPRRADRAPAAFADPRDVRDMTPNASREAGLGGSAPEVRPAGGLAADDEADPMPTPQDDLAPAGDRTVDPE